MSDETAQRILDNAFGLGVAPDLANELRDRLGEYGIDPNKEHAGWLLAVELMIKQSKRSNIKGIRRTRRKRVGAPPEETGIHNLIDATMQGILFPESEGKPRIFTRDNTKEKPQVSYTNAAKMTFDILEDDPRLPYTTAEELRTNWYGRNDRRKKQGRIRRSLSDAEFAERREAVFLQAVARVKLVAAG